MKSLSFAEAKLMGDAMFERWKAQSETPPPLEWNDTAWADLARVAFERLRAERKGGK